MNTKELFDKAIFVLSYHIINTTKNEQWQLEGTTTNNYMKFMELGRPFRISMEGNMNTIYGNEMVNILSRVWHDRTHFVNKFDFSVEGEMLTFRMQELELYSEMLNSEIPFKIRKAVSIILDIEINEQRKYFEENNKFVENQYEFVYNKFKERVENGLT